MARLQAERRRRRGLEKTVSDQAVELRARVKELGVLHERLFEETSVLNQRLMTLEESTSASDELRRSEDNIHGELDVLKAARPSLSWRVAAQERLVAQESQLRCVEEEGVFTAARLRRNRDFTSADFTVHELDVKMRKAILELRRDLLVSLGL